MEENFAEKLHKDLFEYLKLQGEVDEMLPDAPDIEGKWELIASAYLTDGVREYAQYPNVSLGWMMYLGMAIAKVWDVDWERYDAIENPYEYLRNQRGYDNMDEYIREEVLGLSGEQYDALEQLVAECASRTNSLLRRQGFEHGTREAFLGYVACLHELYTMGAAVQLHRMGYHMTLLN